MQGYLHTGEKVAVKVQRPAVLETVTIDLFILRSIGMSLKAFPDVQTDVVGLLDEWAERFFEELDYVKEGQNATKFAEQMKEDLPQVCHKLHAHEIHPSSSSSAAQMTGVLIGSRMFSRVLCEKELFDLAPKFTLPFCYISIL